jgi:hypothetical protein
MPADDGEALSCGQCLHGSKDRVRLPVKGGDIGFDMRVDNHADKIRTPTVFAYP